MFHAVGQGFVMSGEPTTSSAVSGSAGMPRPVRAMRQRASGGPAYVLGNAME